MKTNEELENDVREELVWDRRLDARNIFVAADHGRITLSGSVSSAAAREAAESAVQRVLGVRSLQNQLIVFDAFEQQRYGAHCPRPGEASERGAEASGA